MRTRIRGAASQRGFTLMELMIVVALVALLGSFALPAYTGYIDNARVGKAIQDMGRISLELQKFQTENDGALPESLEQLGLGDMRDPWGKQYIYLAMTPEMKKGPKRKGPTNQPLNTDFDLVSRGADGKSSKKILNGQAHDDVIRAYNGSYLGLAEEL
ncbi:MAG: prepilin-type N-terminal cleavage/methylation domain-containing protein [Pseudomonadota bacterium]